MFNDAYVEAARETVRRLVLLIAIMFQELKQRLLEEISTSSTTVHDRRFGSSTPRSFVEATRARPRAGVAE